MNLNKKSKKRKEYRKKAKLRKWFFKDTWTTKWHADVWAVKACDKQLTKEQANCLNAILRLTGALVLINGTERAHKGEYTFLYANEKSESI